MSDGLFYIPDFEQKIGVFSDFAQTICFKNAPNQFLFYSGF